MGGQEIEFCSARIVKEPFPEELLEIACSRFSPEAVEYAALLEIEEGISSVEPCGESVDISCKTSGLASCAEAEFEAIYGSCQELRVNTLIAEVFCGLTDCLPENIAFVPVSIAYGK